MINIVTELLFFLGAAVLSLALHPIWIKFTYTHHLGEDIRPRGPTTHLAKKGTPTMGGIVFLIVLGVITFLSNTSREQTVFPLLIASLAGLFGIFEDMAKIYKNMNVSFKTRVVEKLRQIIKPFSEMFRVLGSKTYAGEMQSHEKFLIEAAIAGFVAYWTYFKLGWDYIWFPLLGNIHIGWGYPIFVLLLFILVLNCVAFTDGLDGLAGSLGLVAIVAFWIICYSLGYNSLAIYTATFAGALLPFLYFNTYPARIFMGNVGSHVLGATLAVLAIVTHREVALIFIALVFLLDGISSPIQSISKSLTGKKVFLMAPVHHHFELMGWPETKVVFRFLIVGIFCALLGIFVALL